MLPTAATALSAAQLAHVFENGAILSSLQAVCELQGSTHFYAFIFMPVPAAPRQRPGNVPAASQRARTRKRQQFRTEHFPSMVSSCGSSCACDFLLKTFAHDFVMGDTTKVHQSFIQRFFGGTRLPRARPNNDLYTSQLLL